MVLAWTIYFRGPNTYYGHTIMVLAPFGIVGALRSGFAVSKIPTVLCGKKHSRASRIDASWGFVQGYGLTPTLQVPTI